MTKINQEEYHVLKSLDEEWKWIARDSYDKRDGNLFVYPEKPFKNHYSRGWVCGIWVHPINIHLFQFIQWENDEPYNIQELIEEYERVEIEVKSKQELIEKWELAIESAEFYGKGKEERIISYMKDFVSDLKQLDEPEVLSRKITEENGMSESEWAGVIDRHKRHLEQEGYVVIEKPTIPQFVAELIENRKGNRTLYSALDELNIKLLKESQWQEWNEKRFGHNGHGDAQELIARAWLDGYTVEEEQKYYVLSKELHPMLCESAGTDKKIMESTTQLTINEKGLYKEQYALTEQEIKDYDERYWPFAVKVERLEEND